MSDPEKESESKRGLSKEAWAAVSAIVVALIGGMVTIFTTIWKPPSGSSPSPSGSSITPGSPPVPASVPTISPFASAQSPSSSTQKLAQALDAVNIDFSDPVLQEQLNNPSSQYPQFAEGCLKLLSNQRLKNKVYFDVIFWNYTEELKGKVTSDSPNGDLNTNILKAAMNALPKLPRCRIRLGMKRFG
jgi:hypothetical protein